MVTNTKTYTYTDARYLGSKVAADLKQLQLLYGRPSDNEIDLYVDEFVQLVKNGYLESVDYGYKRNNKWVIAVSYEVATFNSIDDNPGKIHVGTDIGGASWSTY